MKKLLRLTLLLCALIVGSLNTWADDVTFIAGTDTSSSTSITKDGITISVTSGTFSRTDNYRCYANNTMTISSEVGTINSISFTFSGSNTGGWNTSYSPNSDTWTSSSASGQARITQIVVSYTPSSTSAATTTTTIDATGITNTDVYLSTDAGTLAATVKAGEDVIEGAAVTWSSSKEEVATIDENTGEVTLVAAGTTIITANYAGVTDTYKSSSDTYELTVTSSAPYVQPTEFDIALNDTFFGTNYGGSASGITDTYPVSASKDNVTVTYAGSGNHYINQSQIRFYPNNKLTFEAPTGYNITKIVFTSAGTWAATIDANDGTYTSDTKTWSGEASSVLFTGSGSSRCDISMVSITLETITPKVLSSISLSGTYPTTFHTGDAFSHEGMTVTANYEGGTTKDVTADATFTGYNMSTTGVQTVTVSYTENSTTKTATYEITVNAPATLSSITLSGTYPTEFEQGDEFSSEGIVVTANWDDSTTSDVTADAMFSGYDMSTLGEQTVTVSYGEKTATYNITIVEKKGTATNPYTVAEAIAYINTLGSSTSAAEVYVNGIISQVDSYNSTYSSITYWISDDGTTTGQMEVYSGKGLNAEGFSSKDDLTVGDIVTVKGYVKMYNSIPEFDKNNVLVSLEHSAVSSVTLAEYEVELTSSAKNDEIITVTYNNIATVNAGVAFYESDGTTPATYDWITASINADNNLQYSVEENTTGAARTAYLKVYTGEVYSPLLTITQNKVVVDYATLPFAFDGGKADIENTNGLTQSNLDSDYASSPYLKFKTAGSSVILKINENPGFLTFDIKGNSFSGGTFTVQTSTDGITYDHDLLTYTELGGTVQTAAVELAPTVRYIKWIYTTKSSGNVALGNIKVAKPLAISAALNATWVAPAKVEVGDQAQVYTVTVSGTSAVRHEVSNRIVPAGAAVLLTSDEATDVTVTPTDEEASDYDPLQNDLIASDGTVVGAANRYCLAADSTPLGVGFYPVAASVTIPAGKAYLEITVPDPSDAPARIWFDGETTAIDSLNGETGVENDGAVYDLSGRRVNGTLSHGLYIKNGKKFIVK